MKISLLIDSALSNKITNIKANLYKQGFRIDSKTEPNTPPHIKLAETDNPNPIEKEQIELELKNVYEQFKDKALVEFSLVNESQNESANWIALYFEDAWLKNLSKSLEAILNKYQINRTLEYKEKIYNLRKQRTSPEEISLDDCIIV